MLIGGCAPQRPGPDMISVAVSNEGDVTMDGCEVWFGKDLQWTHFLSPGQKATRVDFPVKEFTNVDIKVSFENGDKMRRKFSIAFLSQVKTSSCILTFRIDRTNDSIDLVVQRRVEGGKRETLKTIKGALIDLE